MMLATQFSEPGDELNISHFNLHLSGEGQTNRGRVKKKKTIHTKKCTNIMNIHYLVSSSGTKLRLKLVFSLQFR